MLPHSALAGLAEASQRRHVSEVTQILDRVHQGDPKAAEEWLPLVYEELLKLAAHQMANDVSGQTLQLR